MAGNPKVIVDIITDASKAGKGIDEATGKFGKFNDGMASLAGPAAAVLGGITALGVGAVNAASDLEQAAGATESVFGSSAKQIQEWAATAATSVGLSSAAYQTAASKIGANLKNMGVPMDEVAGKTDEMIRLGADLAATYGGTTEEAVSALGAAFRGEADPAERYGLALSQTAVNAELAARGQGDLEGSALSAAKAQIIMEKATTQAGGAIGAFDRESGTLAGSQQRMTASIEDTAAALGQALLPIIQPVVAALAQFAQWVQQNASWITPLVIAIALLAAGVLAYTAIQWALNAAMAANPIMLIIIGVVALVAAFIWLWNNVEGFRNFFISIWQGMQAAVAAIVNWFKAAWTNVSNVFKVVWAVAVAVVKAYFMAYYNAIVAIVNGVKAVVGAVARFFSEAWRNAIRLVEDIVRNLQSVFVSVFSAIQGPLQSVIGFFNSIVGAIQNVISWLGRIKIPDVFGAIGNIIGGRSVAVSTAGVGAAMVPLSTGRNLTAVSSRASSGAGTGGGIVINVNGGLDSADAIARRVRGVLNSRDRREAGVRLQRSPR